MSTGIALPARMPLNDMSWQGIKAVARAGMARDYWKVGDTKTVILDGVVVGMQFKRFETEAFILGFDHNKSIEGRNTIHFGIGLKNGVIIGLCDKGLQRKSDEIGFRMNLSGTNQGGWKTSFMRKTVLGADRDPLDPAPGSLLAALPRSLREVIRPTLKATNNVGFVVLDHERLADVTTTQDSLWLLSEYERTGRRQQAHRYEQNMQRQYEYFAFDRFISGDRHIHKHDSTDQTVWAWSRSANHSYDDAFVHFLSDFSTSTVCSHFSQAIFACFAV